MTRIGRRQYNKECVKTSETQRIVHNSRAMERREEKRIIEMFVTRATGPRSVAVHRVHGNGIHLLPLCAAPREGRRFWHAIGYRCQSSSHGIAKRWSHPCVFSTLLVTVPVLLSRSNVNAARAFFSRQRQEHHRVIVQEQHA